MWKESKAFVRNIIVYFIPFIIMALVAVFFLHHSFLMLQDQNMSVMKAQMQGVLKDLEDNLADSMLIAKDMCIDSALTSRNMEGNDASTVNGISRMLTYKSRMKMCNTLFLSYQSERIVTEKGISDIDIFIRDQLQLTTASGEQFIGMLEGKEDFTNGVLERKDGTGYLLLMYYYPQSTYIEERRIGFLIDLEEINEELSQVLKEINSLVVIQMNNQVITALNCLTETKDESNVERMLENLKAGETISGFTTISIETQYMNLKMLVAVNSGELRADLMREEIKMGVIGIVAFVFMSTFLYIYGRYRYQMLDELKQFAVSHHPELKSDTNENEYSIIRKVLEKDLEKLSRKEEDFYAFKREAKKQLTWLLLSNTPSQELEIEQLMENYDFPEHGPYYGVLEFLLERKDIPDYMELSQENDGIIMQYWTRMDQGLLCIVGISLNGRDDGHEERIRLIRSIRNELNERGLYCKKIASGLVYGSIREIHSSQQEALALIQDTSLWKGGKEVLFFDERAHMTKRVPHITSDLLEQFRDYLSKAETMKACGVLDSLMAPPTNMAEDLIIYVRYKVVSILMEVASEKGVSDTQIRNMVVLNNLESESFEEEVQDVIKKNFAQIKEKSVDIHEITAYIEENYSNTEISQEMLAQHFQSNVRTIRRIMKREIDKTYKEYLNEVRVNKACELLMETDWTIQQISKEVGCYEVASFYRTFKQMMRMTPDEYRSSKKQEEIL